MQGEFSPVIHLTFRREGDYVIAELMDGGAIIPRDRIKVSNDLIQALCAEALQLRQDQFQSTFEPSSTLNNGKRSLYSYQYDYRQLGRSVSNHLVPSLIKNRIKELKPGYIHLHIDEELLDIPWELIFDDEQLITSRFQVCRQIISTDPQQVSGNNCRNLTVELNILIIDCSSNIGDESFEQGHQLYSRLQQMENANITLLGQDNASKEEILCAIEQAQLVHFYGEIQADGKNHSLCGWRIGEEVLAGNEIANLNKVPHVIFACEDYSDCSVSKNSSAGSVAALSFLLAGVKSYTLAPASFFGKNSVENLSNFYHLLASGVAIGVAMKNLRLSFPTDSAEYLHGSYLLYGDPDTRVVISNDEFVGREKALAIPRNTQADFAQGARRQLTVLFCDLVNSTEISQQIDIEDWREILRIYHHYCQKIIQSCNGRIAQHLGDGLLVYFGYPVAFENNAHSAVKAALDIISQNSQMNKEIQTAIGGNRTEIQLQVRVAIHTGLVVVDELGNEESQEHLALGIVPVIASRLQDKATPNSVVISSATHDLIQGSFTCDDLGTFQLKGISEPQHAYRVQKENGLDTRFEVAKHKGLSPFVGREAEIDFLLKIWGEVEQGIGHVVLITGDPGIGKSRLIQEFSGHIDTDNCLAITCHCSPYHQHSPLFPLLNLMQGLLKLRQGDSDEEKLNKIDAAMGQIGVSPKDTVPLLGLLFSIPYEHRYPKPGLSARKEKQRIHELIYKCFVEFANGKPIRLLVEDFHWVDPSTVEFLKYLVESTANSNVMIIVSFRAEIDPPWQRNTNVQKLTLGPLPESSVKLMVENLLQTKSLSPKLVGQLVSKTDGVPLFLEESILMLLADNNSTQQDILDADIPSSLQDLLMARLDHLGPSKHTAQIAAIIGRQFRLEVLEAISPLDEPVVLQQLDRLIEDGLVHRVEGDIPNLYSFKHALICDSAYQSLLGKEAKKIHRHIGDVLSEQFPEFERTQPEIIAYHFTEAGLFQKAVDYWQKAGRRSVERHAHKEAIAHLDKGLLALGKLPSSLQRSRQELDLTTVLAGRIIATQGYGASKVEEVYSRALELAIELKDLPRSLRVTLGLESYYFIRCNFQTAQEMAEQCLSLANKIGDPASILKVHWTLGEIFFHQGNHQLCQSHLLQCTRLYGKQHHSPRALQDPAVMSYCYYSWSQWKCGYPDQALQSLKSAINLSEQLEHPFSQAVAYAMGSGLHLFRGELKLTQRLANVAKELCQRQGFVLWLAFATVISGRARVQEGDTLGGIEEIREGIRLWDKSGAIVTKPYCLGLLAESLILAGQSEEALIEISKAQKLVDKTGELFYQPELYRIRGELSLRANRGGDESLEREAQQYFSRAISIARQQGVKSLELRAETSSYHLKIMMGERDLALAKIYQWFDEGFDTGDLGHAQLLLRDSDQEILSNKSKTPVI